MINLIETPSGKPAEKALILCPLCKKTFTENPFNLLKTINPHRPIT